MNSFPFLSQKMNVGMEEHENHNNGDISQKPKKQKGKHDKPKPWDDDPNIDRWTIEKFDPSWNESGMLEVSSFSTLFPQYRGKVSIFQFFFFLDCLLLILGFYFFNLFSSEKYLQEVWPSVKSALKEYGVSCELNLVSSVILVNTA